MDTLNTVALVIGWIVMIFAGVPLLIYGIGRMYYESWVQNKEDNANREQSAKEAEWARKNPDAVRRIKEETEAWMAEAEKRSNEEFKAWLAKNEGVTHDA